VRDVEVVGVVGGYGLYLGALERSHGVETAPPIAAGGASGQAVVEGIRVGSRNGVRCFLPALLQSWRHI